jgi:L-2-hydroxyglutarate oxidase
MVGFPGFWRLTTRYMASGLDELASSLSKRRYLARCQRYCPSLTLEDLGPYPAGIRAQAVTPRGELIHDFVFADSPRMLHVINAPSPAATAALPIATMIVERLFQS